MKDKINRLITMVLPCKWVVKYLSSSPADYHISNQNAQYSLNVDTPFQMPHPWKLLVAFGDQAACIFMKHIKDEENKLKNTWKSN